MSYCSKCGVTLPPKANYCDACGTQVFKKLERRTSLKIGKGLRITIPKSIAETLGLKIGDKLTFHIDNSRIIIEKGEI